MEYHDSLEEAEVRLAKTKAEAEVMLARDQAMFAKKKRERDLAVASAELNALSLVEEVKMLPGNDESIEKQSYLQQYIKME